MAETQINTFDIDKNGILVNFSSKTGTCIGCLAHIYIVVSLKCREDKVTELTTELGT